MVLLGLPGDAPGPLPAARPAPATGPAPRKPGALPPTAKPNRQALALAMRRLGLDDRGDAVQEWADLLTGAAGATSPDEAFDVLEWIVRTADAEGKTLVYARHAGELARRWAARRRAR